VYVAAYARLRTLSLVRIDPTRRLAVRGLMNSAGHPEAARV
jgi:hypothetical protein